MNLGCEHRRERVLYEVQQHRSIHDSVGIGVADPCGLAVSTSVDPLQYTAPNRRAVCGFISLTRCALVAATNGPIDDGGNGDTLLTLISLSTQRSGRPAERSPNMKSQSHSSGRQLRAI
jgi:hypothetical protein